MKNAKHIAIYVPYITNIETLKLEYATSGDYLFYKQYVVFIQQSQQLTNQKILP